GRPFAFARPQYVHLVRGQYLERIVLRRAGERVRIDPDEERPGRALCLPVFADGLRDGEDVRLVEAAPEGRAAVPRGSETHPLLRVARVGLVEVAAEQEIDVDQQLARGGLSGEWMRHAG